jgi:CheY-like chemotaxis protein
MGSQTLEKPCVLIADDDPLIRTVLRHALEQQGYRVLDAANGDEAILVVERERVALVILDAHMPGPSLKQTIAGLQNHPLYPAPPILVFSGDAALPPEVVESAAGHLSKPVEVNQFLSMVASLFGSNAPAAP